jgi:FkbM family methyltransferase
LALILEYIPEHCPSLHRSCALSSPVKEFARLLRRASNVIVHETALLSRAGSELLKTPVVDGKRVFGLASLEQLASYPQLHKEIVETSRLDDVVDGNIGFIKIDVDGHEFSVLHGAASIINGCRPVLLVECEDRHNPGGPAKLFKYMKELNYIGRFIREGAVCDVANFELGGGASLKLNAPYIYNFFLPDKQSLFLLEHTR